MGKLDINCPHFKMCAGCALAEGVASPPLVVEARAFFKQHGLGPPKLHVGAFLAWRCRAKLAIRGSSSQPLIGLYRAHSHEVVPIPHCQLHHPAINAAVASLKSWIQQEGLPPYDEASGSGALRYVQCVVERSSGKVQLSLVVNGQSDMEHWTALLASLWQAEGTDWHSLWVNFNQRRDNVIFGTDWHLAFGSPLLWEKLCGTDVCFQPANFAQANLDLFEEMLLAIKAAVPESARVVELYAGVGAIGLTLASASRTVSCSDINPAGLFCFQHSAARLSKEVQKRISWQQGDAASVVSLAHQLDLADVVIVDPPRTGLQSDLRHRLCQAPSLKLLIYVSCGWKSFARDLLHLLAEGWRLKDAKQYLLFPGSNHIETVAIFEKMESSK